jgi:hypothetical protein
MKGGDMMADTENIDAQKSIVNVKKRVIGRPFKPGQIPNPGGRPKQPQAFKDMVREYSLPALETVIAIMQNTSEKAADRINASRLVIEYAYGKPTQEIAAQIASPTGRFVLVIDGNDNGDDDAAAEDQD